MTANAAFDLNAAIAAGMKHLESILDPTTGTPYFQLWTLTQSQSNAYHDTSNHPSTAGLLFDRHFVSNVSGRALYALLLGSEVTGTAIPGAALTAYETDVLKSLHRPRDGNWNNTDPANQMVTGLAADPESSGSQNFDMTYLFNDGAGLRGALSLATLTADPNATLSGYSESGQALMEIAIYNIRRYYVYDGTIGGNRVYNWELFRQTLGLQGGNNIASTVGAEKQSNWSNLDKNWVDPFLLDDIVRYYQATGSANALALAEELRDYDFYQRFPSDPAQVPINSFGHMFEIVGEMDAYSRLALVLGDADMMNRVRVRYEALRGTVFSSTGWVPETFGSNSDVGEINDTVELIDTALNFAKFGWTQYYDDVERFTRGQLLPAQLMDTSFVTPNAHPTSDGQTNVASRSVGAYGFPAPYGYVATKNPYSSGAFFTDVTGGGVVGLADVKNAVYSFTGGVHEIDLLFDIDNDNISIVSPYTNSADERLNITLKTAGDVRIRLPSWANQSAISASLAQQGLSYSFENGYVRISNAPVGTAFYVAMPLATQSATDVVNGRKISIVWRGDSVAAMSNMGTPMPFFIDPSKLAVTNSGSSGNSGGSTGSTSTGTTSSTAAQTSSVLTTAGMAANFGTAGNDEGRAIVVDAAGNSFVAGTLQYADGANISSTAKSGDIFLAEFDSSGNLLWQRVIGGAGDDRAYGLARDSAGNLYVTGSFQGTVDFDPGSSQALLTSHAGSDIFVAKYDAGGNYLWARNYGSTSSAADAGYGITVDTSGNVFVTGQFAGTVNFNPGAAKAFNLKSTGGTDAFVLKLTNSGMLGWAVRVGATQADRGRGIAVDSAGRIYVTGAFGSLIRQRFGPTLKTFINSDVFVVRLNANGTTAWMRRLGSTLNDEGESILTDGSSVYVAGYFGGSVDFDPGAKQHMLVSAGGTDGFVLKLDIGGNYLFGQRFGGSGDDNLEGLARKSNGNIVLVGNFSGSVGFNIAGSSTTAVSAGGADAVMLEIDSVGNYVNWYTLGGTQDDRGRSIAVDVNDHVLMTGYLTGTILFQTDNGQGTLGSDGGSDAFLAWLN